MRIVGALDPSASAGEEADFKAWVVLAKATEGDAIYCLHAWIRHATLAEIVQHMWWMEERWPAIRLGAEFNGFQRWLKPHYLLMCQLEKRRPRPIYPIFSRGNKHDRILACQAEFELGRCYFDLREEGGDQHRLMDQFCDLGQTGAHDDGPDAWEMARRMLGPMRLPSFGEGEEEGEEHRSRLREEAVAAGVIGEDEPWCSERNPAIWTPIG